MSTQPVRVVRHSDGIVELLLDDPGRGNALDLPTAEALRDAASGLARDPGGAVLLRAAEQLEVNGGPTCSPGECCWFDAVAELRRRADELTP